MTPGYDGMYERAQVDMKYSIQFGQQPIQDWGLFSVRFKYEMVALKRPCINSTRSYPSQ